MGRLDKVFLLFIAILATAYSRCFGDGDQIETPEQLLAVFYSCLLSERPTKELPQIFSEPKSFASALDWPSSEGKKDDKTATIIVWDYFRAKKNVFLFDGIDPSVTLKKAAIGYCFVGFPRGGLFIDGILCAELVAPISRKSGEGVFKQIRFPLVRNATIVGSRYLINESMITINGIIFGPPNEFERTGDLYEKLGFQ